MIIIVAFIISSLFITAGFMYMELTGRKTNINTMNVIINTISSMTYTWDKRSIAASIISTVLLNTVTLPDVVSEEFMRGQIGLFSIVAAVYVLFASTIQVMSLVGGGRTNNNTTAEEYSHV